MKILISLLVGLVVLLQIQGASIDPRPETEAANQGIFSVDGFLERYGYMEKAEEGDFHSPESREYAIKKFQKFNGMEVTGQIDKKTIEKMKKPRCGVPDVSSESLMGSPDKPLAYFAPGYKWDQKVITWKPTRYSGQLSSATQRYAFENAFKKWSDVTPLKFEYTYGTPDIEIQFARGDHGDGRYNSFDGRGRVLAHAFYPTNGDTHFDDDEKWVFRSEEEGGTDLEVVAAHEFGHALGLGHSENTNALMAPYYKAPDAGWELHYDDILGIQTLYGSADKTPTPSMDTTSAPSTTPKSTSTTPRSTTQGVMNPVYCNTKFDAITFGLDGYAYAFRQSDVYKLSDAGLEPGYPKKSRDVFPGAPKRPGAAFQIESLNHVYIIKGNQLWRYTNFQLDADYPKEMKNIPVNHSINFAITFKNYWGDEQIYLFGDTHFWEFNKFTEDLIPGYENPISTYWVGVPDSLEAGIQWTDNNIYLFKGLKYRKIDTRTRRVVNGYPKDAAPAWFGGVCGSAPK